MKKVLFLSTLASFFCLVSFAHVPALGKPVVKPFKTYVTTTSDHFDISGTTYNPCTGELIDYTGSLHVVMHSSYNDQTGKYVNDIKFNTQGVSGTGETSGAKYQLNEQVSEGFTVSNGGCTYSVTYHVHDVWTTAGSGNNFVQDYDLVYTIDFCASTYTVKKDNYSSGCQ